MELGHLPVLAEEVVQMLAPRPGSLHVYLTDDERIPSGSWKRM